MGSASGEGSRSAFMILQIINQSNKDIVWRNSSWLRVCVGAVNEAICAGLNIILINEI